MDARQSLQLVEIDIESARLGFGTLRRRPEYPGHFEVRRVSACGAFRLQSGQYFLSNALKGEEIGLEEIDDGIWSIVYYNTTLGRIDRQTGKITGNEKV